MRGIIPFQIKVEGQAMTPAERQRLCRARGKGRHRGGLSAARRAAIKVQCRADLAALEAAMAASAPAMAASAPAADATPAPTL